MKGINVTLKSGESFYAGLWTYRPQEGYFTALVGGDYKAYEFTNCLHIVTDEGVDLIDGGPLTQRMRDKKKEREEQKAREGQEGI